MVILSHLLNLVILIPLLVVLTLRPDSMIPAFGSDTDARRILMSLYATIALASLFCLALLSVGYGQVALHVSVTLFGLQIAYKLMTIPVVGWDSAVVQTNLLVILVHSISLASLWQRSP